MTQETTVGSIMTERVVTVEMDDTIAEIRHILEHVRFHHLLVVWEKRLVGILSDRDVLRAISPFLGTPSEQTRDTSILKRKINTLMTRRPVTVTRETPVSEAARLLVEKDISCLPVVAGDREVVGILTWRDILRVTREGE